MITLEVPGLVSPVTLKQRGDAANLPQLRGRLSGISIDLTNGIGDGRTAEHYSWQWGASVGFQDFARRNSHAMAVTPGRQMGWPALFERIRDRARIGPTRVYDAACGFGGIMDELFREPIPEHLLYVGADIHDALGDLVVPKSARPEQIFLLRWDISEPLPVAEPFDFVICRAAIHHTADPAHTFGSLVRAVGPAGRLAITVYAKKGRLREVNDDALRKEVSRLSNQDAIHVAGEFTELGKALQAVSEKVKIEHNLDWLGIPAGEYGVQELVYDYILKCWFNPMFGEEMSSIVNFDWYHPTYAHRYDMATLRRWFEAAEFKIEKVISIRAQHYLEGVRL